MICTHCGSQEVIYDYSHGYLVCTSCGLVLGTIFLEFFEEKPLEIGYENNFNGLLSVRKGIEKRKANIRLKAYTKMSFEVLIYEKYAKKARKHVYVDFDAALKKELRVSSSSRVYHHKDEDKVLSLAEKDPVVKLLLEHVVNKDPVLSSRTPRGKIALAIIIKKIINNNSIDIAELCKETSMSSIHMRRLLALVKKRLPYIKKYVSEINNGVMLSYTPHK